MIRPCTALLALALAAAAAPARAVPPDLALRAATGDGDEKVAAVHALAATADPSVAPFLEALRDGAVRVAPDQRVLVATGAGLRDAATGEPADDAPATLEEVFANNRLRTEIDGALAGLRLLSADPGERRRAAETLLEGANPSLRPLFDAALARESDPATRGLLRQAQAGLELADPDPAVRRAAVETLGAGANPRTRALLLPLADAAEPDGAVRAAAGKALRSIDGRLAWGERLGHAFGGLSLGSILLLAALGLAVTYGLMGVINMAHGELIMVGAYATYAVQNLFRTHAPGAFDWYPLAAVPASFAAAALAGVAMERCVIRFLYGRPLETLLATWGLSLGLMQGVRSLFGAQNVAVENPAWLSGGVQVLSNLVLPYNRLAILGFALAVVVLVWAILTRTRLGLQVRAVTQNRPMAGCLGVRTPRVDLLAFGLGSGVAGLAGCALSQVGNVGPALGQSYIVDSFLVVVLGGVGQLAGSVYAALGLGVANKLLEPQVGAVLAKIAVLLFIVAFIQRRPQGLFALKGRFAEA
ncbi:MAG: urea ABC transporter permease subunit UrtB [Deferrisomatales bacterium]